MRIIYIESKKINQKNLNENIILSVTKYTRTTMTEGKYKTWKQVKIKR